MTDALAAPSGVFDYPPADRVRHGPGQVAALPEELSRLGTRRAFVVTGRSLATKTDVVQRVEALLGERHAGTYAGIAQHVPSGGVAEATRQARDVGADVLISVGGGSPVDAAKLVALALAEGWTEPVQFTAHANRGARGDPPRPLLPHIAVGTTLSAAEFTGAAGVTDEQTRFKGGHRHPAMVPIVVILDPELKLATPWALWAASGIKALDHAVERLIVPGRQPFTSALCVEAIRLLLEHLPHSAADQPGALARRGHGQVAAWLSLYGYPNVPTGLSHALGHQIGAFCGVPHGITSCVTLPPVVRHVRRTSPAALAGVARAFGLSPDVTTAPDIGEQIAGRIAALVAQLGLPGRLRDAGVAEDQLEPLLANTVHELQGRGLASEDEIRGLLLVAW
ncbi:MAG: iron-containing alcohol dehydrogenase [Chloroflexi bacterium]|nr:iron-containing alcohol dehydrogenase [Chloroflexota bacterium]